MTARRDFGTIRRLPSGRYQASYVWPPVSGARHNAPLTFEAKIDASAWLAVQRTDIQRDTWGQPAEPRRAAAVPSFAEYAARVIARRVSGGLRPSTERRYRGLLAGHLLPAFGATRVDQVTVAAVNEWHASYGRRLHGTRAGAYRLLVSVMRAAIDEGLRESNPCRVRGGCADPQRAHDVEAATVDQVDALADGMRPAWRMIVLLA
ncbi:MAG TPA: hypothetical protein VIY52_03760, partial [Streptosporangiaceae bacterium]